MSKSHSETNVASVTTQIELPLKIEIAVLRLSVTGAVRNECPPLLSLRDDTEVFSERANKEKLERENGLKAFFSTV